MRKSSRLNILAIETSCDETAASVVSIENKKVLVKSSVVASQVKIHALTGGVVPEVAARAHIEKIIPVVQESLGFEHKDFNGINAIAVTSGPGLMGSLLVGAETAKTIAYSLNLPIIPINHIEAHIYANFIGESLLKIPCLCLVVSGGHTSLVLMRGHGIYKVVGETLDDAAGEAFDKAAAILGLPYPGGPSIAKAAAKVFGDKYKTSIKLPRPLINESNYNFSFSGLKTALLYRVREMKQITEKDRFILAAEFQRAVVDVLVVKTLRASEKFKVKSICLAGGVAANSALREEFKNKINKSKLKINLSIPDVGFCTDNAAIVGVCAAYKILVKNKEAFFKPDKIEVNTNLGF